ncbi:MAG: hypothetical protein ACLVFT_00330 [Megasphaera lornae]
MGGWPVTGILAYTADPTVSSDYISDPHSAIVAARNGWWIGRW